MADNHNDDINNMLTYRRWLASRWWNQKY